MIEVIYYFDLIFDLASPDLSGRVGFVDKESFPPFVFTPTRGVRLIIPRLLPLRSTVVVLSTEPPSEVPSFLKFRGRVGISDLPASPFSLGCPGVIPSFLFSFWLLVIASEDIFFDGFGLIGSSSELSAFKGLFELAEMKSIVVEWFDSISGSNALDRDCFSTVVEVGAADFSCGM